MTALLLGGLWKYLAIGGAALLALIAALVKARRSGAAANQAKHDKAKFEAAQEQLEMHREADKILRDNAALADAEARRKAGRVVL